MPATLYHCYFSLRQPLVQTQVLPYLREIVKGGVKVHLLTFEPEPRKNWTDIELKETREALAAEGISWDFRTYHKRPSAPATVYDIFCGVIYALRLTRREKIDIFHARGHIPAPIGAIVKAMAGGKLLFDIRGFLPEEYTDAGVWSESGQIYRSVKRVEKWLMRKADGFVVLTESGRDVLFPGSRENGEDGSGTPVEVIPCCIEGTRFALTPKNERNAMREKLGVENRFVITHIGSLGGLYLTDNIMDLYSAAKLKYPNAYAMILTQNGHEDVAARLKKVGYGEGEFLVAKVSPTDIFGYLTASDMALSIVKESYSSLSRSPTKVPEYLAAGLPIVSNPGVGDIDALIAAERVGVILNGFSKADHEEALAKIEMLLKEEGVRERCREVAFKYFDLETVGGPRYRRIYEKMLRQK